MTGCHPNAAAKAKPFARNPRLAVLALLFAGSSGCLLAQTAPTVQAAPDTEALRLTEMERRLDSLTQTLAKTQAELRQSLLEIQHMRAELDSVRSQAHSAPIAPAPPVPPPAPAPGTDASLGHRVDSLEEQQEVLQAEVKQHDQIKVETELKYKLRVTGLVLFNAFSNAGVVDDAQLPAYARARVVGSSHGSSGATLSQTVLGVDAAGPVIGGARTSALVNVDFFGYTSVNDFGYTTSTGSVRMREAEFALDWNRTSLRAGYTSPLISPWSPTSYATVAEPALAWSGNLWMWAPQLSIDQRIPLASQSSLHLQVGLLDPPASNTTSVQLVSPVEASRLPGLEGRLSYSAGHSLVLGVGGYTASQVYTGFPAIHSWAVTGDWRIPLSRWASLSGELYRGNALGGLGGGAYKDTVTGTDSATGLSRTLGVETAGGWAQFKLTPNARTEANFMFGLDDAFTGNFKRLGIGATPSYSTIVRNSSVVANFVYRPLASVVLSPEYRRILTWTVYGPGPSTANIFTLSAGYRF
jgi:hypothetical protein